MVYTARLILICCGILIAISLLSACQSGTSAIELAHDSLLKTLQMRDSLFKEAEVSFNQIEENLTALAEKRSELTLVLKEGGGKKEKLNQLIIAIDSLLTANKAEIEKLKVENIALKNSPELRALKRLVAEKEKELAQKTEDFNRLLSENQQLKGQLVELKTSLKTKEENLNQKENTLKKISSELNNATAENQRKQQALARLNIVGGVQYFEIDKKGKTIPAKLKPGKGVIIDNDAQTLRICFRIAGNSYAAANNYTIRAAIDDRYIAENTIGFNGQETEACIDFPLKSYSLKKKTQHQLSIFANNDNIATLTDAFYTTW
jgi:predicted  nucleic acid-binding Zn-ribbon protein